MDDFLERCTDPFKPPIENPVEEDKMTEQELTYNINQELRCCASGFHSISESRLAILALIKEAGYVKLADDQNCPPYASYEGFENTYGRRPKDIIFAMGQQFREQDMITPKDGTVWRKVGER